MANEKSNKGVKTENNDHINLKVVGQDDSVVQFKIKRHTPLSKLMKAYCDVQLEMEDGGTIDVFQQQTGVSTEKVGTYLPLVSHARRHTVLILDQESQCPSLDILVEDRH
ncbi:small ubiquitin-related modifier 2 [Nomascus leucogenys]|uniref:small ubiquitin-related modifier 2 n=1 Tax=Nomascus leucogenys TaxID=61853 RepID=UPI00122DC367|nr:small ubiquitin-related modifier 2 [Nomascus leucogenys]